MNKYAFTFRKIKKICNLFFISGDYRRICSMDNNKTGICSEKTCPLIKGKLIKTSHNHKIFDALNKITCSYCNMRQIIDVARGEWQIQGCWSEWDEKVYKEAMEINLQVNELINQAECKKDDNK